MLSIQPRGRKSRPTSLGYALVGASGGLFLHPNIIKQITMGCNGSKPQPAKQTGLIEFTLSFKCKDCSRFKINGDCLTLGTIGNLNAVIKNKNSTITIPGPKQYIVSITAKHHYELSLPACDAGGANEDVKTILMKNDGFRAANKGMTSMPAVDMDKLLKELAGNEKLRNAYDIKRR